MYKLYTSTVAEMLSDFAEEHGLLQVGQEGFRRLRGTGRQLQALVGAIEDSNLTQRDLLILYVDFMNAFGSVDHKRLFAAMRTMGVPDDCIEVIADLYMGATTQVCTPKGRTENVPFLGRGTVQGDSLSPLVFLLCIEPLLRWLAVGERGYRLGTSKETLDGLAYADDLAILMGTVRDTSVQIRKVAEFCAWSGMEVNIKGTDKTALTAKFYGERRVRNAEEAKQLMYPSITWTAAAGAQPNGKPPKPIPFLLPTQQYVYLGVQVTLNLTWAAHQRALLQKVRAKGKQIATSAGTVAQKVRMIRQVLIPAIRYSMVVVPFTAQALDLLDCAICKVHKAALGLSVTTSTAAVAMGRDCFGAGAGTVRGVYAQVTTDAITDAMQGSDRIARVVRGVLTAHEAGRGGGHWARVPDRLAGRWPLLAAVVRSARLGITWPALGGDGPQTQVRTNLLNMLDPEEGPRCPATCPARSSQVSRSWSCGVLVVVEAR